MIRTAVFIKEKRVYIPLFLYQTYTVGDILVKIAKLQFLPFYKIMVWITVFRTAFNIVEGQWTMPFCVVQFIPMSIPTYK